MTDIMSSVETLKQQARRLRQSMAGDGVTLSHAQSLEAVAHQHGYRDWNTARARIGADAPNGTVWQVGQQVRGRYLGQPFAARIRSVTEAHGGHWHLTLRFEAPVDVVTSPRFSNLRQQVQATVNARGVTHEKTSDGAPHLQLQIA